MRAQPASSSRTRRLSATLAAYLAARDGRLGAAEASLVELQCAEANLDDASWHTAAPQLAALYAEAGDAQNAIATAEDYLRKLPAWTPSLSNTRPFLAVAALERVGRMDVAEARERRRALFAELKANLTPAGSGEAWDALAATAGTASEAADALAELGSDAPARQGSAEAAEGWVRALTGDEKGIAQLRAGLTECGCRPSNLSTVWILDRMRQRVLLGQMLEKQADRDGACEQYAVVLASWGNVRPHSVTADQARARSKALGCPR